MSEIDSEHAGYEAGFNKVRHGIPYERELKAMSDSELAVELGSCGAGSPRYLVLERERARRANAEDAKAVETLSKKRWFEKPIGQIGIGVIITVVAAFTIYLIKNYVGIAL